MTHLSLFSGIGGLDIAAEAAGFETVGQCEWDDYPTKVLEKHWPDVPRWKDIRSLTGDDFREKTGLRTVDVVSGGFPCQPFSVAGKQKGKGDCRYLWPEMLRVVSELEPCCVVGENVPGILRLAADDVVSDLERLGFEVVVFDFEAAAVGAPHRRERIAFVAINADRLLRNERKKHGMAKGKDSDATRICADVSYAQSTERSREWRKTRARWPFVGRSGWWKAEPDVGRVAYGVPHGMDRLRCLGNAVVPAQFYPIFCALHTLLMTRGECIER